MATLHAVESILMLKARLLAGAYLRMSRHLLAEASERHSSLTKVVRQDNLHREPWIFLRLSDTSHVRMIAVPDHAPFELAFSNTEDERFIIRDTTSGQWIADGVQVEEVLFHNPRQLFYSLYEYCSMNCKFCPLSITKERRGDTLELMIQHIDRLGTGSLDCIGITSAIPPHLRADEVALEMAQVVRTLRKRVGPDLPIGVSPKQPSREVLLALRDAGANEVRLNLETYDPALASLLMPNKDPRITLRSIEEACEIFGRGKVSSNIILGIGETDEDVIIAMRKIAELGAIATLYPYDLVSERDNELKRLTDGRSGRPTPERLIQLALEHKHVLEEFDLDPNGLRTMCPRCGASHIMPGKDL